MENEGGQGEVAVGAPEIVGEEVFGGAEIGSTAGENVEIVVVPGAETTTAAFLPPVMVTNVANNDVMQDSNAPTVDRDAERMPKEYAKHLVEVMRKYKGEPNKLQRSVTSLKWDYMKKAFNRNLGDGLDGRATK